jgi:hypothetical protein
MDLNRGPNDYEGIVRDFIPFKFQQVTNLPLSNCANNVP